MVKRGCLECGESFEWRKQKNVYCSERCQRAAKTKRETAERSRVRAVKRTGRLAVRAEAQAVKAEFCKAMTAARAVEVGARAKRRAGRHPPIEWLRDQIDYDPLVGVLTWRVRDRACFADDRYHRQWNALRAGKSAGGSDGEGYWLVSITFGGRVHRFYAHRLIWALVHNYWPIEVDHKDGDGLNNRLANLREAVGPMEQRQNIKPSPMRGLSKSGRRYQAQINAGGQRIYLGSFATAEEARARYLEAKAARHWYQPVPRPIPRMAAE